MAMINTNKGYVGTIVLKNGTQINSQAVRVTLKTIYYINVDKHEPHPLPKTGTLLTEDIYSMTVEQLKRLNFISKIPSSEVRDFR
jgi:hypothetical protein